MSSKKEDPMDTLRKAAAEASRRDSITNSDTIKNSNSQGKNSEEIFAKRGKKTRRVQAGLSEWYYKEFEKIAKSEKRPITTLGSIILEEWIDNNRKK